MSPVAYADLLGPDGTEDNMGGLVQECYYARKADFLSIEKPVANPTTFAGLVEIVDDHTFKPTKCWQKLYCTMDKGKFDAESQGENDGKSFKEVGEIFYPGSKSEAMGFAAQVKNDNFIVLFPHPDSDVNGVIQCGTEMFPAKINPAFTSATNSGGVKGWTFKVEAMTNRVFIYKGAISFTPAA